MLDAFLLSIGFKFTHGDPTLYSWCENKTICFLLECVNDLVLTGNCTATLENFDSKFLSKFEARVVPKFENVLEIIMEDLDEELKLYHKALISRLL